MVRVAALMVVLSGTSLLSGCSSPILLASGLSDQPERGSLVVSRPARVVQVRTFRPVYAQRKTRKTVTLVSDHTRELDKTPVGTIKGEEPGDRAARRLDAEIQRLESSAKNATRSICRGC